MITLITYNLRYNFPSSRRAAQTASTSPRTSPAASGSTGRPSSPSPGNSGTGDESNQPRLFSQLFSLFKYVLKGPVAAMPSSVRPDVRGQRGVPLQRGRAEGGAGADAIKRGGRGTVRLVIVSTIEDTISVPLHFHFSATYRVTHQVGNKVGLT